MPFIRNLKTLGIDGSLRIVDPVQYRARRDAFDFDITIDRFSFSSTPGDSLRSFFSAQAAALKGSNNLAGIADPAVDALIETIIAALSRPALVTACRALDRVIRSGRYWIPNWYKPSHWIAYWDVLGRPPGQPRYFRDHAGLLRGGSIRPRRTGRAGHCAAFGRGYRRHIAHFRLGQRRFQLARRGGQRCGGRGQFQISRRAGPRSRLHQEPRETVR